MLRCFATLPDHWLTTCIVSGCCRVFLQLPSHLPCLWQHFISLQRKLGRICHPYGISTVARSASASVIFFCHLHIEHCPLNVIAMTCIKHTLWGKDAEVKIVWLLKCIENTTTLSFVSRTDFKPLSNESLMLSEDEDVLILNCTFDQLSGSI